MYKDLKAFVQSKSFQWVLVGVVGAVVVLLIFQAGLLVGYRKASFAYRFGDNYYRAFEHRPPSPFNMPIQTDFISAHGGAGKVISVSLPTFVIAGPDEREQVVLVTDETLLRRFDTEILASDIKVDDFTVVLGAPNESSQIEAKFIRILPSPPQGSEKIKIRQPI